MIKSLILFMQIKEEFLHYVWLHKFFDYNNLYIDDGTKVEIIDFGTLNHNSGPDIFNAKIKINNTIWVGNIEIHINASDWYKHKHDIDKSYNNVILHVVSNNDKQVFHANNKKIPTIELKINHNILNNYSTLIKSENVIKCGENLANISSINFLEQIDKMGYERLMYKSNILQSIYNKNNDIEKTWFIMLFSSIGLNLNTLPFELLANNLDTKLLFKYSHDINKLEALLFGVSGFLNDDIENEYYRKLQREFRFLSHKYQLKSIENHLWKFSKTRPNNFPTIRIAQLASLINKHQTMVSKLISCNHIDEIYSIFNCSASKFWDSHFTFKNTSKVVYNKTISKATIDLLIINCVSPFLHFYGDNYYSQKLKEFSKEIMHNISKENNNIVRKWEHYNLEIKNAFDSQALIHLYKNYCITNSCYRCSWGHKFIAKKK